MGHHAAVLPVDLEQNVANLVVKISYPKDEENLINQSHLEARHLARRAIRDIDDGKCLLHIHSALKTKSPGARARTDESDLVTNTTYNIAKVGN